MYKINEFGKYKMHGSIINVFTNVNQTQSIIPHVLYDDVTISVFLKLHVENKCFPKYGDYCIMRFN
jgi:hypothetical protein